MRETFSMSDALFKAAYLSGALLKLAGRVLAEKSEWQSKAQNRKSPVLRIEKVSADAGWPRLRLWLERL
ncbi:MAG: hypothetical protein HC850_11330 [Rhodomicrobium sp.]|nr:hypothetical protein [Rhodomicrobium sp.]